MVTATRACGDRVSGGCYLVTRLGPDGAPIEDFLVDPPIPVDMNAMGISALGVSFVPHDGRTHIADFIGEDNYPNVSDVIEECRRMGLSRRVSRNLDFSRLLPGARILLIHARAIIENATDYYRARPEGEMWCPTGNIEHVKTDYAGLCASCFHEDITDAASAGDPETPGGILCGSIRGDITGVIFHRHRNEPRAVVRTLPSFSYRGFARPDGVRPIYHPAIFASLPIHGIEVIYDREGASHVTALEKASRSGLQVEVVEE